MKTRIAVQELSILMKKALHHYSLPSKHIDYVVESLINTSLRGVDTHGVRLFENYLKELEGGRSLANPQFQWDRSFPAVSNLDAAGALGVVAGRVAVEEVISIAQKLGIAAVAVRNSNHFGAASVYTLEAAKAGLLCFSFSNADSLVSPFHGKKAVLGTNPISFAAPAAEGEIFCLDMATSQISFSKVMHYLQHGTPLEQGWATDKAGKDSSDTQEFEALQPLGGYKGQGLGMMVQILSGLLTEMPYDHELSHLYDPPYDVPRQVGHCFIALETRAFTDPATFSQRLSALSEYIRQSPKGTDKDRIYVPGDLEQIEEQERLNLGIPVTEQEAEFFTKLQTRFSPI